MQCKEWDDANSELFKESHDEAVHKNSYKSRLYELISASLVQLMGEIGKHGVNLPLRGRSRRQKGCISLAPQARLCGFIKNRRPFILKALTTAAKRHIKFIARRAILNPQPRRGCQSSRRNQITLSAPHRTVRAVFPHTALRIVLGVYSLHLISCSSVYI